ncbi:hypothetical protein BDY24DRAFT_66384 [Mrakia frigida]|uniref:uncharacterized protein n=1 Tax=Mrakia frigida TaxID=29902 RepID=UPI003FCC20E9
MLSSSSSSFFALLLLSSSSLVSAAGGHSTSPNHHALAARKAGVLAQRSLDLSITPPAGSAPRKRGTDGKCKIRQVTSAEASSSSAAAAPTSTEAWAPAPTSTAVEDFASTVVAAILAPVATKAAETTEAWVAPTTTTAWEAPAATTQASSGGSSSNAGILSVFDSNCGASGSSSETSNWSGPNGAESWITCGVNSGGWTPPCTYTSHSCSMALFFAFEGTVVGLGRRGWNGRAWVLFDATGAQS